MERVPLTPEWRERIARHQAEMEDRIRRCGLPLVGLAEPGPGPGMVGSTEFSGIRMRGDEAKARAVYQGVDPLRPEDVAEAILWVVTRPAHVNVGELVLWASAQASTTSVQRRPG